MQSNEMSDPVVVRTRKVIISISILIIALVASVAFLIFWFISTLTYHDPVTDAMKVIISVSILTIISVVSVAFLIFWFISTFTYHDPVTDAIVESNEKPGLKVELIDKKGKSQ